MVADRPRFACDRDTVVPDPTEEERLLELLVVLPLPLPLEGGDSFERLDSGDDRWG
jgi:hypothetical protein